MDALKPAPCYMCGAPSTKRLTPDLDIQGIPLCADAVCGDRVKLFVLQPDLEMNQALMYGLERERRKLHKEKGNRYTR